MNKNKVMNKYSIIIVIAGIFLLFSCPGIMAQDDNSSGNTGKTGWHLDAGGGVQTLFSSDVTNLSFTQRFTPFASLGVGKWISPLWGVRLQAAGYSLNGFSTTEGTYLSDPLGNGLYGINDPVRNEVTIHPDGSYRHYLRYLNVQLAVEVSLFNWLCEYSENRRWDIIPALGVGYLRSLGYKGTPVTDKLSANLSLKGKYALTPRWDVNLEVSAAAFDDKFDGRITGRTLEAYSGIMLGISYNFSKPVHKPRPPVSLQKQTPPTVESNAKAPSLDKVEERLSAVEKKLDRIEGLIAGKEKETEPEPEKKPETEDSFILASVLFGLNRDEPFNGQDITLINVVKYLNEYPDAKIRLDGYGDGATGTPEQNLKIAIRRAENLLRTLTASYGIAPKRVETQAFGSSEQPYEKNEWNRLVLIRAIR
jgi:outer membrane protein OmpA-like peptidoglycan-associated protein